MSMPENIGDYTAEDAYSEGFEEGVNQERAAWADAGYQATVKALSEAVESRAQARQERDAALARVADLQAALDSVDPWRGESGNEAVPLHRGPTAWSVSLSPGATVTEPRKPRVPRVVCEVADSKRAEAVQVVYDLAVEVMVEHYTDGVSDGTVGRLSDAIAVVERTDVTRRDKP